MIDLFVYRRPALQQSVEDRYQEITKKMLLVDQPFGWQGMKLPPTPSFDEDGLTAHFEVSYPSSNIHHHGYFHLRDANYLSEDRAAKDDAMSFSIGQRDQPQYSNILLKYFPQLVAAFDAYRAVAYFDNYVVLYYQTYAEALKKLRTRPDVNVNGRNNIFTLHPAQYWDAELCQRAMGYGRDEVIKRLTGKVPLVRPLMDGVYVVFNDNPDLTFDEFCAYNDRLKPVLGLQ
ncbi:hypothetical protein [Dongia rigui]|uniref:Uncharacterized protein n=1 Tax=Dongia rigui TaxID=940149 RepID=A0ABU5E0F1_9PROT|nr:hypothetical protein [Dongia rigui]MDY0872752.1 hypothetical protein [Dongia rigui]